MICKELPARASVRLDVLFWDDCLRSVFSAGPEGVRRSLEFRGWLWDNDRRIDGKPGTLEIYIDDNRAREWKSQHDAFGTILLMKGAEPDEGDAFRALLYVENEIGDLVERAVTSVQARGLMTLIRLRAALDGLPMDRRTRLRFYAEDLDLSDRRCGEILEFELSHWRPVSDPHLPRDGNVNCTVAVIKSSWWGYFPFGPEEVSLSGVITRSSISEVVDLPCRIVWSEYNCYFDNDYRSAGLYRFINGRP